MIQSRIGTNLSFTVISIDTNVLSYLNNDCLMTKPEFVVELHRPSRQVPLRLLSSDFNYNFV